MESSKDVRISKTLVNRWKEQFNWSSERASKLSAPVGEEAARKQEVDY
jgi:hypothetical protein